MTDPDFPSINDSTQVFKWIYGMPADAVFRNYVLAYDGKIGVAFSSLDSGVVLVSARPVGENSFAFRLYEKSGAGGKATITLRGHARIGALYRVNSDGIARKGADLQTDDNTFTVDLRPGEVANLRMELK